MKNSKITIVLLAFTLDCSLGLNAQDDYYRDDRTEPPKFIDHPVLYLGTGKNYPNNNIKTKAFQPDVVCISIGASIPFSGTDKAIFALCSSSDYFFSNKTPFNEEIQPLNVIGQQSSPVIGVVQGSHPALSGFNFGLGLQLNILMGKHFLLSPSFEFGFMSLQKHEFDVIQTSTVNSKEKSYTLMSQSAKIEPGISSSQGNGDIPIDFNCFTPKLKLHYFFNNQFGLWAEANYLFGAKEYIVTTYFLPNGSPDQNGEYTVSQMDAGKHYDTRETVQYTSFGFKVGILYVLPVNSF